jgi:hypothetical protein
MDALSNIMREERMKNPSNEIPDLGGGPGMAVLMTEAEAKAQQQQEEAYQARVVGRATQAGLSPDQVNACRTLSNSATSRRSWVEPWAGCSSAATLIVSINFRTRRYSPPTTLRICTAFSSPSSAVATAACAFYAWQVNGDFTNSATKSPSSKASATPPAKRKPPH